MFLPDRYIKGTCPNCGTPDQYGDNCENCGATYAPTDLIDPHSVVSGATPELRDSEHYFFKVGDFATLLRGWLAGKLTNSKPVVHSSVAAKLKEWLDSEGGVRDWDISRDAPYFGFPIPDAPGKFFYVWLDAPVGYLASFKNSCTSISAASWPRNCRRARPRATRPPCRRWSVAPRSSMPESLPRSRARSWTWPTKPMPTSPNTHRGTWPRTNRSLRNCTRSARS